MSLATAEPLIRFVGVTKIYGHGDIAYQALKGIDLEVAAGDFVAIMGPSGSGKSTAMNILGCLDTPSSGEYMLRGLSVISAPCYAGTAWALSSKASICWHAHRPWRMSSSRCSTEVKRKPNAMRLHARRWLA